MSRLAHQPKVIGPYEVLDVLSGLHLLRHSPPAERRRQLIWSDGKTYPVEVVPGGLEQIDVDGRPMVLRRYTVTGLRERGARFWAAQGDIWLSDDARAVPVEILYRRRPFGALRLTLVEP